MKKLKTRRFYEFKKTHDEWYGNYEGNKVKLGLSLNIPSFDYSKEPVAVKEYKHQVNCWGNDDFGMDKWFPMEKRKEAIRLFEELKNREYIDKKDLKNLGFEVF